MRKSPAPPLLLKVMLLSLFVFPSYMVLAPVGASGSLPQLLALGLFGLWALSSVLGQHQPLQFDHPGRSSMLFLLLVSLVSYALLYAGLSGASTEAGRSSADRWILLMLAMAGIAFVTTESLRTLPDVMNVVRWLLAGGVFCCLVAVVQFATHVNPVAWFTPLMAGFVENADTSPFQARGQFMRVSGTALHSIELGVVCSMLLPLAVWRALYDRATKKTTKMVHWMAVGLFILANAMTVSRSGLIGLIIALGTIIPFLSILARKWITFIIPIGVATLYVASPELVLTIFSTAIAGDSDSSIVYRTDDYPMVLRLLSERPLFGSGPGTWMPALQKDILDNGYLYIIVTLGASGLIALLAYMLRPLLAAFSAAKAATAPEMKLLAASAAAACLIATVATGTFDSFSFPTFALLSPFFVGLSGACWLMVRRNENSADGSLSVQTSFPKLSNHR